MRWPIREPQTGTRAVVRVCPGVAPCKDGPFSFDSRGWASYVSMDELARHNIGWPEIDSACASIDPKIRDVGEGLLLGNPKAVRAYLGLTDE